MGTCRWFAAGAAALLVCLHAPVGVAAEAESPARYWYDGTSKSPLYRQPQLDAASNRGDVRPGAPNDRASLHARAKRSDRSGLTVYATGPDLRSARLMTQAPGILFTVADDALAKRAQAWLAARGLRAEPIAGGAVFKVGAVTGEKALDLANALYESGLVQYAQPNWVMDVDRTSAKNVINGSMADDSATSPQRTPANRNVERALSEALSPPRQRCAELHAAISQANMDAKGSRIPQANPPGDWHHRSRNSMLSPARAGIDKQARLEAESAKLKCERLAK